MPPKIRTAGEASRLLSEYEAANADLPKDLRVQMAMFVLAPRVGRSALEELFDRPLGTTPWHHRSWLWWQALRTSDMGHLWDDLVAKPYNEDTVPLRGILEGLREASSYASWNLFSKRLGKRGRLQPAAYGYTRSAGTLWSKGGVWVRDANITRVIWFGDHLERDYSFNSLCERMGPDGAKRIERELQNLINPDAFLFPDAIALAMRHVSLRIPQEADWKIPRAHYITVSWFFQCPIPDPDDLSQWYNYTRAPTENFSRAQNRRGRPIDWSWLPKETT